jgi:N-acetylneuraminic acid mutarotase
MNKFLVFILLFFFISGSFTTVVSFVLASNSVENSWTAKTPMSQGRHSLGVIVVNSKIYAIGGIVDGVEGCVGTNECYDPMTDSWVTLEPMPTPRSGFVIVAYQDKIYCVGGYNKDTACLVTEVYDTVTNSWCTKASMPRSGMYLHASIIDGKFFIMYGSDLFMYDPIKDLWTAKTCMPELYMSTSVFGTVVLDNKLIVIDAYQFEADVEQKTMIYDTETDLWSKGSTSPSDVINTRFHGDAVVTTGQYAPKKIYTLHLTGNNAYDPTCNTWTPIEPMSILRSNFGVAVVDDILYIIGGYTISDIENWYTTVTPVSVNEQYVPLGYYSTLPAVTAPTSF